MTDIDDRLTAIELALAAIKLRIDSIQLDPEGHPIIVLLERSKGQVASWLEDEPSEAGLPGVA